VPHGFGNVNVGDSRTFTYVAENIGGGTLTGTASTPCVGFSVAPPFPNLAAGQTVNLVVTFAPPSPGTFTCQLVVVTNGGSVSIDLSGTAQERPAIPVVPSPTSPSGIAMIALLSVAIGWALRRRVRATGP
jgi:MYXO-CTERM domain-containing protein